ncbi:DUF2753 family protein [Massilia forsythiae]|uniref:DUF2753 family protein n=1 Tax=Massilia forsythiae TaxID=2728020 RepID=A0A7Z2ZUV3_9BURK|nr:DUF2753 family protein [Massilia forsythiae]QJE02814.1 DUF2753 family protein [Massilia forsythiae]
MHMDIAASLSWNRSPQEISLPRWEAVTRKAIALMRSAGAGPALADHECALAIACRLIDAPPSGRAQDCVAALVVSHHNLADLWRARGDTGGAAAHLCRAHEALLALASDDGRDACLRQAALRHLRETHLALVAHAARHGPHDRITRALRQGMLAFERGPARH